MKRYTVLFVFVAVLFGCKKEEVGIGTGLLEDGIWVEAKHRRDTIVFKSFENENTWLILHRGLEYRNGNPKPKIGSGPYVYRIDDGGISLYYTLSSNYRFDGYPFEHTGTKFKIGDFYDGTGTVKTFVQANR